MQRNQPDQPQYTPQVQKLFYDFKLKLPNASDDQIHQLVQLAQRRAAEKKAKQASSTSSIIPAKNTNEVVNDVIEKNNPINNVQVEEYGCLPSKNYYVTEEFVPARGRAILQSIFARNTVSRDVVTENMTTQLNKKL